MSYQPYTAEGAQKLLTEFRIHRSKIAAQTKSEGYLYTPTEGEALAKEYLARDILLPKIELLALESGYKGAIYEIAHYYMAKLTDSEFKKDSRAMRTIQFWIEQAAQQGDILCTLFIISDVTFDLEKRISCLNKLFELALAGDKLIQSYLYMFINNNDLIWSNKLHEHAATGKNLSLINLSSLIKEHNITTDSLNNIIESYLVRIFGKDLKSTRKDMSLTNLSLVIRENMHLLTEQQKVKSAEHIINLLNHINDWAKEWESQHTTVYAEDLIKLYFSNSH